MNSASKLLFLTALVVSFTGGSAQRATRGPKPKPQATNLAPTWPLKERFKITPADLAYGKNQLRQLIKDRPAMIGLVTEDSPVWQWAARQFAGVRSGDRVDWHSKPPADAGYEADHM